MKKWEINNANNFKNDDVIFGIWNLHDAWHFESKIL